MKVSRRTGSGFTLLEVMVSIGLLSLVAVYAIQFRIDMAKQKIAEQVATQVMSVANIATAYYAANAEWPATNNEGSDPCEDLGEFIRARGFVPDGLQVPGDVTFTYECPTETIMGRPLQITLGLGVRDPDMTGYLLGLLPNTVELSDTELVHYVSPPRKLSSVYQFQRVAAVDGTFRIEAPVCRHRTHRRFMLLPQAVCLAGSDTGLGGFYFVELESEPTHWIFALMVAAGGNNNNPGDFELISNTCGGQTVYIGAITYCDEE